MKLTVPRDFGVLRWLSRFIVPLITLAVAVRLEGDTAIGSQGEPAPLYSSTVKSGDRKVTYQRIQPPAKTLQAEAMGGASLAMVSQTEEAVTYLNLSCTVYGGQLTEVRWWLGGAEYRARSSINFHHLRSLGRFEFEGRAYSLMLGIGDESLASLDPEFSLAAFQAAKPSQSGSWYETVAAPEGGVESGAFVGLDDLHRYFDTNETTLLAQWQTDQALAVQPKAPITGPTETVIRFWPRKSRMHLPLSGEAAP